MPNDVVVVTNDKEAKAVTTMLQKLSCGIEKLPMETKEAIVALGAHYDFIESIESRSTKLRSLLTNIKHLKKGMVVKDSSEYKLLCKVEKTLSSSFQTPLNAMKDFLEKSPHDGERDVFASIASTAKSLSSSTFKVTPLYDLDVYKSLRGAANTLNSDCARFLVEGGDISIYRGEYRTLFNLSMYGYTESRNIFSFGRVCNMLATVLLGLAIWFTIECGIIGKNTDALVMGGAICVFLALSIFAGLSHYISLYREYYEIEDKSAHSTLMVNPSFDSWSDSKRVRLLDLVLNRSIYGCSPIVSGEIDDEFIKFGNSLVYTIVYGDEPYDTKTASKLTLSSEHAQKPVRDITLIHRYEDKYKDLVKKHLL